MNVKELKELLEKYPDNLEVAMPNYPFNDEFVELDEDMIKENEKENKLIIGYY